jgi:hypothetical protein
MILISLGMTLHVAWRHSFSDEITIPVSHRQVEIRFDSAATSVYFGSGDWVAGGLIVVFPMEADAALLPTGNVVEIDSVLEEEFVLVGDRSAF